MTYTPTPDQQVAEYLYKTDLPGLWFVEHKKFTDERGFYAELSRIPEIEELIGQSFTIKQMNLSYSQQYVTRGFHAENWNKLITCITGTCLAVLADIRPNSPTFKTTQQFLLGDGADCLNGSLFVSAGIANSLCVLEGSANYLYAVDQLYAERDTSGDVAISLFDKDLNVAWPIQTEKMILSERDQSAITLREKYSEAFSE